MKSIGIIGAGSFGVFLAKHLEQTCQVKLYSKSGRGGKWAASLDEVAKCDYLILSIPLEAYTEVLQNLKPLIGEQTVIVDVCSVKEKPVETIKAILPGQPVVATHPLFGPESATESLAGHTLVLCPDVSTKEPLQKVASFVARLGMDVVQMSCAEHDKEMAVVQGLTFFIARSLHEMGIHNQRLQTPTFMRLLYLAEIDSHHSDELFYTIQQGNAQAIAVRERFLKTVNELNQSIESE